MTCMYAILFLQYRVDVISGNEEKTVLSLIYMFVLID